MASMLFDRATRYQSTFAAAMPNLPYGIQVALKAPLGTADAGWALALVLAGWRLLKEADSGDAQAVLKETGAQPLVDELNALSIALPEPFKQALTAAESPSATFAGAATYLTQAFTDMIDLQRNAVIKWMGGELFRSAGNSLTRRFQPPGSQPAAASATWGVPSNPPTASAPSSPTPTPRPSRLERFERADRPPPRARKAEIQDTAVTPVEPPAPAEPASAPPTPQVPPETVARIHLMTQAGWAGNDADRILSGPKGDSGSALQLRQFLRTYASLSYPQRSRFQGLVEQQEESFEPSRTALLTTSIADIQNVRDIDALPIKTGAELLDIYEKLPVLERQRALRWITDRESTAFANLDQLDLPTLYGTYRNLQRLERMRFLKVIDEIEEAPKKDAWKTADIGWVTAWMKDFAPEPNRAITTAAGLYKAYRRLSLPKRMSLVRAVIENEKEFTLEEMNKTSLGKIDPEDLE